MVMLWRVRTMHQRGMVILKAKKSKPLSEVLTGGRGNDAKMGT
jgi:hypothetical protein